MLVYGPSRQFGERWNVVAIGATAAAGKSTDGGFICSRPDPGHVAGTFGDAIVWIGLLVGGALIVAGGLIVAFWN